MSHLYPGINPLTVYSLTYRWWLTYLAHTREYRKQQQEANRGK